MKFKFSFMLLIAVSLFIMAFIFLGVHFISANDQESICKKCLTAKFELNVLASDIVASYKDQDAYPDDIWKDQNLTGSLGYLLDKDPWDYQYQYSIFYFNGYKCFLIGTFGSDNLPSGTGSAEDIFHVGMCKLSDKIKGSDILIDNAKILRSRGQIKGSDTLIDNGK